MPKPRLVAVVVTFNRLAQLQTTVARLLEAAAYDLAAVLVVDNASTDGTDAWLTAQNDARLHRLRLETNNGGAGGFEAGMRHAMDALHPDWLILMDDDARPTPETLARFHAEDRTGHDGWVAATFFPDGDICEMNRPALNPFFSLRTFAASLFTGRAGYHLGDDAYHTDRIVEVDGASFVGFFVSRPVVEKIGYPDGRLFIYGDDALFSIRLRKAGFRIGFDPKLRFEHDCGTEMGTHPIKPLWKVYFMYRNQLLTYRAAAGPVLFWPILVLKLVNWRRRAGRYGADRATYLSLLRRALRDGIKGRRDASFDDVRHWAEPSARNAE